MFRFCRLLRLAQPLSDIAARFSVHPDRAPGVASGQAEHGQRLGDFARLHVLRQFGVGSAAAVLTSVRLDKFDITLLPFGVCECTAQARCRSIFLVVMESVMTRPLSPVRCGKWRSGAPSIRPLRILSAHESRRVKLPICFPMAVSGKQSGRKMMLSI